MNWVKQNKKKLSDNNYIRKADASTNYWLDIAASKLEAYEKSTKGNFNIIFYGDEEVETDYYIIPYQEIKHLLKSENFSGNRKRWVGNIINHQLSIANAGIRLNIAHRYSVTPHESSITLLDDTEENNDCAIENAKREVQVRLKQSKFRRNVLKNFEYKCCLTGLSEAELLVASHIIPWSAKIDTRLSTSNGLCLSILYDSLFDKGYFSFNDNLEVLLCDSLNDLSGPVQKWLIDIKGRKLSQPLTHKISLAAVKYHRENILNNFR